MLISCIIPTRNRPEFVVEAAQSVLAQTHADLELIIVNDGSTPVPSFDDSRVRVIDAGERGAVPARNLGVAAAKGEAIAWLDDDDVWTDQNFLSACEVQLSTHSDFVFGDGTLVFPGQRRKAFAYNADAETLKHDNTILISAVCYRKSLHDELGTFDETLPYYWDWDWYLRVAHANKRLTRLSSSMVDIRIHAQNMSGHTNVDARQTNLRRLCDKHGLSNIPLKSHADFV